MNDHDFRMWLAGFLDAIGDIPTAEQMAAVKAKLGRTTPDLARVFQGGASAQAQLGMLSGNNWHNNKTVAA